MSRDLPFHPEFLDAGILSSLPDLELQAKFLVSGFMSGLHRSPLKGGSSEFKEFRDYQQGDELKLIDWKLYARTDRLHVRLHEEDTDMTAYILLDRSASMDYKSPRGSMTKWNFARAVAAALIHFLHRQRDSVSLSFMGAGLEDFAKPASKTSHIHRLMACLHKDASSPSSDIAGSLESVLGLVRRRSIVIVISDFYTPPRSLEAPAAKLRHLNCELILLHVLDPRETLFDFDSPVILEELEGGSKLPLSPDLFRKEYKRRFDEHVASLSTLAGSLDGDYVPLSTEEVPLRALGAYLHRRELML